VSRSSRCRHGRRGRAVIHLEALQARGFNRILIEGGAHTVSRFIAAGCLDRLHVVVAPIIIGAGPSGVTLKPIDRADQALKAPMRAHLLGAEVLCGLRSFGSAGRGRAREKVHVTDPHR